MTESNPVELVFLPLGGAGEIGMNLSLYGYGPSDDYRWLMIDLGVTFGAEGRPGVDVVMPDPSFIAERRDRLDALLLTHAHEDHLGAVAYLWPRLRCPVYGSPFTLAVLRRKLADAGLEDQVPIIPLPEDGRFRLGAFEVELIGLTHSIPEMSAVVLRSGLGTVVHSGDWKLDPDPVIGSVSDENGLGRIGDEGVLALVCDSTNVFEPGRSGSEGALLQSLTAMIGQCTGKVVITCFSSNIARLHTIASAAAANGRDIIVTGASLKRNCVAARACGYLQDLPPFIDDTQGGFIPAARTAILSTGGQGEPQAALFRLANGDHPQVKLEEGDTVIFSARVIPGNEVAVGRLQNLLLRRGLRVLTHRDGLVHVSGHPAQDELVRMYDLVRPRIAVPVHGELRHMLAHERLAREHGIPETVVGENGALIRLAPGPAAIIDTVQSGRLALDGNRMVSLDSEVFKERSRMLFNGVAIASAVLDRTRRNEPEVHLSTVGLLQAGDERLTSAAAAAAAKAIDELADKTYNDDDAVRETVKLVVRRTFRHFLEKRPLTCVHVIRL